MMFSDGCFLPKYSLGVVVNLIALCFIHTSLYCCLLLQLLIFYRKLNFHAYPSLESTPTFSHLTLSMQKLMGLLDT